MSGFSYIKLSVSSSLLQSKCLFYLLLIFLTQGQLIPIAWKKLSEPFKLLLRMNIFVSYSCSDDYISQKKYFANHLPGIFLLYRIYITLQDQNSFNSSFYLKINYTSFLMVHSIENMCRVAAQVC